MSRRAIGPALLLVFGMALGLEGCAPLSAADRAPRTDPLSRLAPAGPSPWTVDFGDPVLAALLRRADAGGLDIKSALARLARAQADVETAQAARTVHLTAGVDAAGGGRTWRDARSAATPAFEAPYTVDLWGQLRLTRDAAALEQLASQADVATARLLVGAETTRAYLALAAAQDTLRTAETRARLADSAVGLVDIRRGEGVVTAEAVAKARQAAQGAQAQVAEAREEQDLQTQRLADLVGAPGPAVGALTVPVAAPAMLAVSSDLVEGRPDVRAALARLQAADAARAAAIAASRPRFEITALLGAPDATLATLLDTRNLAWAVAASLSKEVLDGGAARAKIHAAGAEADLADIAYRKAVMAGWSEIRAALTAQARAQRAATAADMALAEARRVGRLDAARRAEGAVDGIGMAQSRQAELTALDDQRAARLQAAEARIQLALATGGR